MFSLPIKLLINSNEGSEQIYIIFFSPLLSVSFCAVISSGDEEAVILRDPNRVGTVVIHLE